jgi:hypothetical protein
MDLDDPIKHPLKAGVIEPVRLSAPRSFGAPARPPGERRFAPSN